jgi:predicted enzyme related to lactoylglutathione lyase
LGKLVVVGRFANNDSPAGGQMSSENSSKGANPKKGGASIVWFEIPTQNLERARAFYNQLFGWNIDPFPGMQDYWHIDTGGADATPDGALMARKHPAQSITNYVSVDSVNESVTKIQLLGGKVCMGKTAVPQMGYFAICEDTEGNTFAVWERNENAK